MALLSCENIALGYDGDTIVSDLTFEVKSGNYLCIVGENGSGKSTLLKTMLHLIPPISGRIHFGDGVQQNEVGYLPQQTIVQKDFPASVWEVVLSGCVNRLGLRPFYRKEEKKLALKSMERMDIPDLAKHSYRDLSGGQQQRVLLARALCATRKLLILDEPVAGLDPKATLDMYSLIEKLNNEGLTIIMISHDITAATQYASHILHIGNSQPLFFGETKDYLESDIGKLYVHMQGGVS
ncbi:zinc transport system ATP-binding protein [Aequitasia blattaphilus]|uniref:ABC transporter ATP-binding protein n=1 Tax=Aequitasia blattaphilus TaxID=2949332 RepID=A0ABT1E956_9FIRM|nr:ABC transporter ATP-binding protein [Aequitasia blattaphilus]MCP1102353.1 ABC transporter ATP-binding protein [Aequitasia blattaphilus]MCR8614993.1 ABC transporter ATP-binding protein [Aequitasia blattaphilus]